ncbi:MAG TPA: Rieske 2Fe-2S domain-containing protein [Burkholderiales bacterium]|nr:Rieske 2Fe-2S domain-containing protein [Burkholderiales bacterium]
MNIDSLWRENSVHRAAYVDPAVFALEQERIFRRAWLYVGHESEVPRAGDYVLRRLGPEEVLLVRREDGGLSLLHNRCAHRGARIVAEPAGNARQLRCPYHAWTYALDGRLIGVPLADGYAAKPELGLSKVARVESYRGFVFGSHAAQGPGLAEFLGGLASAFDNMLDRAPAGTVTRFGGALRLEYRGNWKMFMENAVDLVHPNYVHRSSIEGARTARGAARAQPVDSLTEQASQMFLANGMRGPQWDDVPLHAFPGGHVYMGGFYKGGVIGTQREDPVFAQYRKQLVERHGEEKTAAVLAVDRFNNLVWPNVSVNSRFAAMRVVHALAADRTQVEVLGFRLDGAAPQMHELTLQFINLAASPASLVASDDLELFERCQRGLSAAASDWIDVRRGVLSDRRQADGSTLGGGTSELAIRNQFEAWLRHMR